MPTLGNALDFAKYEGRNFRGHQLGAAPSSPVTGQVYYNTADNTLYWWDGSQWVSARGGAAATPPATTSSLGTIQLAGDLAGTATSPQIAAGVITDAEVAAANKDGVNTTPSMRTIGQGAGQAMAGGSTLAAISLNNPNNGSVNLNTQRLTNLADPTAATDGANKQYVDNTSQGLDAKMSVKAASTANLTLSGTQTVDGIALIAGDRCLVKDQSTQSANGLYVVAAGAWTRTTDMDTWAEVPAAYVWVEQGTVNADSGWVSTADQGGTLGTTSITWTQFSGAGAITAGAGLTKTGATLDVGAGTGITVAADTVAVDATIIPRFYSSATHGAGTTISITKATHGCRASRGLLVQVQDEATGNVEIPDISVAATGDVTITYGASVTANSKRVTVMG